MWSQDINLPVKSETVWWQECSITESLCFSHGTCPYGMPDPYNKDGSRYFAVANHLGKSWANKKSRSVETCILLLQKLCQALLGSVMIPSRQLSQLPQSHKHSSGIYWSMFWAVQENVTHWEVFRFELKKGFCALQTITEKKIVKHFWKTHSFHIISRTLDICWLCICIFFLLSGLCGDTVFTWEPQGEKLLPHSILIRLETAIFFSF